MFPVLNVEEEGADLAKREKEVGEGTMKGKGEGPFRALPGSCPPAFRPSVRGGRGGDCHGKGDRKSLEIRGGGGLVVTEFSFF